MRMILLKVMCWVTAAILIVQSVSADVPTVTDDRLTIELFAEAPQIVTPTGIAVDRRGRVFVVESHTHFRPTDYDGPPADRIRLFEDADGDGRADRVINFHEGLTYTMDIELGRNGWVYIATRSEIYRMRDNDDDGVADEVQRIIHMDTPGTYPHNGLSGLCFDFAGNLYFGLGENLGEVYTFIGADGRRISGGGEGGSAYRCKPDGSQLTRIATGFWNPFGMTIDAFGRIFATDNDPGSSPPCRLHYIVEGGDYGYEYRYGRTGQHPLITWRGELPGTLPMIAGTGEAPCGLISYESDHLPDEYRGDLLVASWGDNRVERYRLRADGASFETLRVPFIEGGEYFRPVGIATAPDGSLYISDWVDRSYALHKQGRIWHVRIKDPGVGPVARPDGPRAALASADRYTREQAARKLAASDQSWLRIQAIDHDDARVRAVALEALVDTAAPGDDPINLESIAINDSSAAVRRLAAQYHLQRGGQPDNLLRPHQAPAVTAEALRSMRDPRYLRTLSVTSISHDPFIRNAAIFALSHMPAAILKTDIPDLPYAEQRVAMLTALKRSGDAGGRALIRQFLNDRDPGVRFAAAKWIADEMLVEFRPDLVKALQAPDLTPQLFRGCLAALDRLDGKKIRDEPDEGYLIKTVLDDRAPITLRALSLRMLRPDHPRLTLAVLRSFIEQPDEELRLEAVRVLAAHPSEDRFELLAQLAKDESLTPRFRAEAVCGLAASQQQHLPLLLDLATGADDVLADEALRSLVGAELTVAQVSKLNAAAAKQPRIADAVARITGAPRDQRPSPADTAAWLDLLDQQHGDADAGRRIFFGRTVGTCSQCHTSEGRGNRVGPDLSFVGQREDVMWLIESILQPSREIAPQFQPWMITTRDGQTHIGFLMRKGGGQREAYMDITGREFNLQVHQIVNWVQLPTSLMAAGLGENLTTQEFRDLISYLMQRR